MDGFSLSKTWKKHFEGFCIEYKRWEKEPSRFDDPHDGLYKWNVYVYVYPEHPLFQKFSPDTTLGEAHLPGLHGYPSYFQAHYNKDKITGELKVCSYQIGSDYGHYRDHYSNEEEPFSKLLHDVQELIEFMENYAGTSSPY